VRIALYDFLHLDALAVIDYPDAMLTSPTPAEWKVEACPGVVLVIRCVACMIFLPQENKHNPMRTFVAIASGPNSAAALEVAFGKPHPDIAPQLLPQAARAIRAAMKMGDAR